MFLAFKKYGVSEPYEFSSGEFETDPSTLKIDPIDCARTIKPPKLLNLNVPFTWFVSSLLLITSITAFEQLFITPMAEVKINWAMRTHESYEDHLQALHKPKHGLPLIEEEKSGKLRFVSKYFAVSKKCKILARTIFNGRALSRLQRRPDTVNLPEIPCVLKEASRIHKTMQSKSSQVVAPAVFTADIRHYFHEIEVSPEISVFFGVVCRGKAYSWRGLPMGWAHSPRIAQSLSWGMILHNAPPCLAHEVEIAKKSVHPPSYAHTRDKDGNINGIIFIWYDNIVAIIYGNDEFRDVTSAIERNRRSWNITWSSTPTIHSPKQMRAPLDEKTENQYPQFLAS